MIKTEHIQFYFWQWNKYENIILTFTFFFFLIFHHNIFFHNWQQQTLQLDHSCKEHHELIPKWIDPFEATLVIGN